MKNKPSFIDTLIKEADKRFDQIFKGTVLWKEHKDFLHAEIKRAVEETTITVNQTIGGVQVDVGSDGNLYFTSLTNSEGGTK